MHRRCIYKETTRCSIVSIIRHSQKRKEKSILLYFYKIKNNLLLEFSLRIHIPLTPSLYPSTIFSNSPFSPLCATMPLNTPSSICNNSLGVPNSAATPSLITKIRSKSITVLNLCATTNRVVFANSSLILLWISLSVFLSTALVASSNNNTLGRERIARAKHNSCFCP